MALEDRLLIVVNPASSQQPAIERTVNTAKFRSNGSLPAVTLLIAIDHSCTDTRADNEAIYRDEQWLKSITTPLQEAGIEPTIRITWSKDWADSILYSANQVDATSIVISHPGKSANRSFTDEFWYVVRNTPVPVCVVQSSRPPKQRPVLVAMDVQDSGLTDLNRRMLEAGKLAAELYGAELHFANAYPNSLQYPDRARIEEKTGIANENIHLKAGTPDEALRAISEELDPDLIIIGASRRTGIRAALRGKKLSNILMSIEHDLFVIV